MADTSVKFFHSAMVGAPVLSGAAGTVIGILDACLVNGFALKTADSLTIASGVATLNISTGHSFEVGSVALVAGATVTGGTVNGEQKVTAVTANTASFAVPGLADQTASGTVTAKLAPAGWQKQFSGTNLAVYKSLAPDSFGCSLRVDDSSNTDLRVVGYESMTGISTGTGPFPTNAQISGGAYWAKSGSAGATARNWMVFADARMFYWWCVPNSDTSITSQGILTGFGDLTPLNSIDVFATYLAGASSSQSAATSPTEDFASGGRFNSSTVKHYFPRSYTGLGSSVNSAGVTSYSLLGSNANYDSGGLSCLLPYPNPTDTSIRFWKTVVYEGQGLRADCPGIAHCTQNAGFLYATKDIVAGSGLFTGRQLLVARVGAPGYNVQNSVSNRYGFVLVDITGPWR
jgi:hypothetical protein